MPATIHKAGERVGAILGADGSILKFLGYGIYEGEFYPIDAVGVLADGIKQIPDAKNPKIALDTGETVWGCECWWGNETAVKAYVEDWKNKGRTVISVSIEDVREKYKKEVNHARDASRVPRKKNPN